MKAIRFDNTGGPEVLELQDVDLPPPGAGQVRIRHSVIGVNFIDTYHRSGLYPIPLPSGLGLEAAGTVEALGADVTSLKQGDRVGYCTGPIGAYAEANNVPADRAFFVVFALGCWLAGLAGVVGAPGSLKGAFAGALLVGFADTFGQVFVPELASVMIYAVMAAVLLFLPAG